MGIAFLVDWYNAGEWFLVVLRSSSFAVVTCVTCVICWVWVFLWFGIVFCMFACFGYFVGLVVDCWFVGWYLVCLWAFRLGGFGCVIIRKHEFLWFWGVLRVWYCVCGVYVFWWVLLFCGYCGFSDFGLFGFNRLVVSILVLWFLWRTNASYFVYTALGEFVGLVVLLGFGFWFLVLVGLCPWVLVALGFVGLYFGFFWVVVFLVALLS